MNRQIPVQVQVHNSKLPSLAATDDEDIMSFAKPTRHAVWFAQADENIQVCMLLAYSVTFNTFKLFAGPFLFAVGYVHIITFFF